MNASRIRILHVVGPMTYGGIETWLMHVLRAVDRKHFQMDLVVPTGEECPYDKEILALGSKLFRVPVKNDRWRLKFNRKFLGILKGQQPYDIIHSHRETDDGLILRSARKAGVIHRISHSHNDTRWAHRGFSPARKIYHVAKRWLIDRHMTTGLACSEHAAADLFGEQWKQDSRCQILPYGISLENFAQTVDRTALRQSLGIRDGAIVIGHVGRFVTQKNHDFVIGVMREVVSCDANSHLLLVGDGPLRPAIQQRVAALGLTENVTFLGNRKDVAKLMSGAMDVVLFPSFYEGLPMALIEAQAANLRCVYSDAISPDISQNKTLMRSLSLDAPASLWAQELLTPGQRGSDAAAVKLIAHSPFNLTTSLGRLTGLYLEMVGHAQAPENLRRSMADPIGVAALE